MILMNGIGRTRDLAVEHMACGIWRLLSGWPLDMVVIAGGMATSHGEAARLALCAQDRFRDGSPFTVLVAGGRDGDWLQGKGEEL
jgi:hypothetical protein